MELLFWISEPTYRCRLRQRRETIAESNCYNEWVTGYDRQGNILGLKRTGRTSETDYELINNLSYKYDGNQLMFVKDNAIGSSLGNETGFTGYTKSGAECSYDSNGNLTKDLRRGIVEIQYNYLHLPKRIVFSNGHVIKNLYGGDGRKLRTIHVAGRDSTVWDYVGNAVYENDSLKFLLTDYGYVSVSDGKHHYFLKDHLATRKAGWMNVTTTTRLAD